MKIGFIILNYNTPEMTRKLAMKVETYNAIDNVVIIDNCSTDNSYEMLKKIESNKITVLKTLHNGGYSYGNNYGMSKCLEFGDEYAFVANPDVEVTESCIDRIVGVLQKKNYALVTCLQYEIDGKLGLPAVLKQNSYKDDLMDCFYLSRRLIRQKGKKDIPQQQIIDIEMFRGSFFAVEVKAFMQVNGFDEGVFLYCEERILSRKLMDIGKKMALLSDCRYEHMHSVSIDNVYKNRQKKMRLLFESRLYYNMKYNSIGIFKKAILTIAMKFSLLEYSIADTVGSVMK